MRKAVFLLALCLLPPGNCLANDSPTPASYPAVAARDGEICVVCGSSVSSSDLAIIVKGRRLPVMKEMVAELLQHPETYFKTTQLRSALFQEEFETAPGAVQSGVGLGWFLAGAYILSALIFGGLSGGAAIARGLPPIPGFFAGLALNVLGYLYVLTRAPRSAPLGVPAGLAKVPVTQSPLACPQCGSMNHPAAASCSVCHVALRPQGQSDLPRIG
jgi:hypothetical protein